MKLRDSYTCPLEIVHDIIKGKWKPIIIFQLRNGACSFSELHHSIKGVTQKMLLEQLQELQSFELINKVSYEGYPLRVEYSLSDEGFELLSAIFIMQAFGIRYMAKHAMNHNTDVPAIADECLYTKK